jgi:SagB-type dehydrogenase family enzyme
MKFILLYGSIAVLLLGVPVAAGERPAPLQLPAPQTDGGRPLMQVLKERSTSRSFSARPLPPQVLSNLLWAAFGINRPVSGKRTAPSAKDWQEIDIYVALAEGLFRYEAAGHRLEPVLAKDIRAMTGRQPFVAGAPVNLLYVADRERMGSSPKEDQDLYAAADSGFIGQNVYLFCASEGLATVIRGSLDRPALAKVMGLRPGQWIVLAQTVGYREDARQGGKDR